jgi:transcriptional regulator with XRE-family HTH domain
MARGKVDERDRARALRAQGWSLPAIEAELGVSRSSVSLWCRDIVVPHGEWTRRLRAPAAGRKKNSLQVRKEAEIERLRQEGRARLEGLTDREHLVAGLMLYAGEGAKGDGMVKVANTDPRLIAFCCAWLRRHFEIDEARLRFSVYLHEGLDLEAAESFWSEVTCIPRSQALKPYRAVDDATRRRAKHIHGCCYVSYCSSPIHRSIMGMLAALMAAEAACDLGDRAE